MILDFSLTFDEHLTSVESKTNKTISLNNLPRQALITRCKAFVSPHLNFGDILYDQTYNVSFHQKLEKIQCNACIAITGTIRSTSKDKIYQYLALESFENRRWFGMLCWFRILKNKSSNYLFRIIPQKRSSYIMGNSDQIPLFNAKHNFYKNSFFPGTAFEWNNLDQDLANSESYTSFSFSTLKFIRPSQNSFLRLPQCYGYIASYRIYKAQACVIHENTNLNTVFRIRYTHSVIAGWKSNQQPLSTPMSLVDQRKTHPHKQLE